ncbi:nucleolar complex protein 14 [Savitreella phatthalungensis]
MAKKGSGSQLKRLKTALRDSGLSRGGDQAGSQGKKKKGSKAAGSAGHGANGQGLSREEREAKLAGIRSQFNPYEVQMNRTKFAVGGRKVKGDQGRPGAAASAAERMRVETLGRQREMRGRAGGIVDRRFGEGRTDLTPEEVQLERFTRERQKASRRNVFSLDDDDAEDGLLGQDDADLGLTHMGQSLSAMDDFGPAPVSDDEDMGAEMVARTNFGGFDEDLAEDETMDVETGERRKKTKNEIMAEIIAKSKQGKYERQRQAEEDEEAREALDAELEDLQMLLADSQAQRPQVKDSDGINPERMRAIQEDTEYDKAVKELIYDRRAQATERTKTEEELIEEEAKRLHEQEESRLKRMRGEEDDEDDQLENGKGRGGKRRRRAAQGDDLSDDFAEESDIEDESENEFGLGVNASAAAAVALDVETDEDDAVKDVNEGDVNDEEDEDEDDHDAEDYYSAEDEADDDDDDDDDGEDEEDDDDEDDEDLPSEELVEAAKAELARRGVSIKDKVTMSEEKHKAPKAIVNSPSVLKFTYPCPSTVSQLQETIEPLSVKDQLTALHRIKVLHHPKLNPANGGKLDVYVTVLIDYLIDRSSLPGQVVDYCTREIFELSERQWEASAKHFLARLDVVRQRLYKDVDRVWSHSELTLFALIGKVWSVSDNHHRVVTPAFIIAGQYLAQNESSELRGFASKAILCGILLGYVTDSKRYLPEVVLCLRTTLEALKAEAQCSEPEELSADLSNATPHVIRTTASRLALAFAQLYTGLPGYAEAFTPLLAHLEPREKEPLGKSINNATKSRKPLQLQQHRAIGLATYVPKFEESFDPDKKSYDRDADRQRTSKLKAEVRDARRGAVRVLRRDAAFDARQRAQDRKTKGEGYRKKMGKIEGRLRQPDE